MIVYLRVHGKVCQFVCTPRAVYCPHWWVLVDKTYTPMAQWYLSKYLKHEISHSHNYKQWCVVKVKLLHKINRLNTLLFYNLNIYIWNDVNKWLHIKMNNLSQWLFLEVLLLYFAVSHFKMYGTGLFMIFSEEMTAHQFHVLILVWEVQLL